MRRVGMAHLGDSTAARLDAVVVSWRGAAAGGDMKLNNRRTVKRGWRQHMLRDIAADSRAVSRPVISINRVCRWRW
jgi:hypothetical protein